MSDKLYTVGVNKYYGREMELFDFSNSKEIFKFIVAYDDDDEKNSIYKRIAYELRGNSCFGCISFYTIEPIEGHTEEYTLKKIYFSSEHFKNFKVKF